MGREELLKEIEGVILRVLYDSLVGFDLDFIFFFGCGCVFYHSFTSLLVVCTAGGWAGGKILLKVFFR